jgi:cation:H+ antiporter
MLFGFAYSGNTIIHIEGLMLVAFFAAYLYITYRIALKDRKKAQEESHKEDASLLKICALIVVGIAALVIGGRVLALNAVEVANRLHISESVIGMTILAGGTSLPELATSVVAARKGSFGLALGNVVGSNIVNIAVCIGLAAMIFPIASKFEDNRIEFITMILASLVVLIMAFGGINLVEGIILLALLALFIVIVYKTKVNSPEAQAEAAEMGEADMPMWRCILYILAGLVLLYF